MMMRNNRRVAFGVFVFFLAVTVCGVGTLVHAADRYIALRNPDDEYFVVLVASQVLSPVLGFLFGLVIRMAFLVEYQNAKVSYLVTLGGFLSLLLVILYIPIAFSSVVDPAERVAEFILLLALIVPSSVFYGTVGALIAALVVRLP